MLLTDVYSAVYTPSLAGSSHLIEQGALIGYNGAVEGGAGGKEPRRLGEMVDEGMAYLCRYRVYRILGDELPCPRGRLRRS